MGQIKIQDSGYIKSTNEGTQASSGNRANAGTVISIKSMEFIPQLKRNISANPDIGSNEPSEVNLGSLENMQFTLRCLLNTNIDTDMALLQHLLNCISTNGYKFMWYDYTNATNEKNNGQLIYQIALNSKYGNQFTAGEQTAFSVSAAFYHLHVLLFDSQFRHTGSKGNVIYEFKGIVIPSETSIV